MFFDDNVDQEHDSEDVFAHTRMTFGDHIEVLRLHLFRAIFGFGIALVAAFFIGEPAIEFIARPVRIQLKEYGRRRLDDIGRKMDEEERAAVARGEDPYTAVEKVVSFDRKDRDAFRGWLGLPSPTDQEREKVEAAPPAGTEDNKSPKFTIIIYDNVKKTALEYTKIVNDDINEPTLKSFTIMEAVMVYFKVCVYIGLVLGSPWIFYQLWSFVAAGLYPHEKKLVHYYLPFSLVLFLIGICFCQFIVIPKSIRVLLEFNAWLGIEPELRLTDWLSFAITLPVVFGISFQTPLVMMFLQRLGLMTIDTYRSKRKYAWFGLAVIAVVILPTPDVATMMLLWIPLIGLYELGILLCWLSPARPLLDLGLTEESDEMIEV
jgi:sec-independent protein translocase protein TatC